MSKRITLPFVVAIAFLAISFLLIKNPPEGGQRQAPPMARITVSTVTVTARDFPIFLKSYGEAKAATQSMLVSQVAGQIVQVSPNLKDGSSVKKDEILVKIDDRDYQTAVMSAEASLLDAQRAVVEERARAKQAALDWKTLGRKDEPSDLVLRKPQLMAAEAQLKAAEAQLSKTKLALERTNIRAAFDGRVLSQKVDLGQYINAGTAVAEIYANNFVEVRLPLCNCDLDFIDLKNIGKPEFKLDVKFYSSLSSGRHWTGYVSRVDSAIDSGSRQLHVIAQIDKSLDDQDFASEIKIGEYLTADIEGKVIDNAIVIPNRAIYQSKFVYIVQNDLLQRRDIDILWQNNELSLIGAGIDIGDQLVITPLGQVTSGTRVTVEEKNANSISVATTPKGSVQGASE